MFATDKARRCWVLSLVLTAGCGGRTPLSELGTNPSVRRDGAGTGGAAASGGAAQTGGISGQGGTTGSSGPWGMPCTTSQDCPSDAICCDGSTESCDGTRLPSGDGENPGEFVVGADALTVTDTMTGLVWQRDGSGARSGCSGSGNLTCTWTEAQAYCASLTLGGVSGWRLPARMELFTIVDFTRFPSIDSTVFPNTGNNTFWTSSPSAYTSGWAWYVSFAVGASSISAVADYCSVRCVRGARCRPKSRFVVLDGGLVRDTLTDLVWQQQAISTSFNWVDAQSYCSALGSGFRLPTVKELSSIVDLTVSPPKATIDSTAFPNDSALPDSVYWTSSPCTTGPAPTAQMVYFGSGGSCDQAVSNLFNVRCVR